jgi:regulator of replication initiation timing
MPKIFYKPPSPPKPKPGPSIITVRQHHPWLCPIVVVLSVVVVTTIGLFLYQKHIKAVQQSRQALIELKLQEQHFNRQQLKNIIQKNANLITQNQELRDKLTTIVQTTQESQNTYTQVLQSLTQLQVENRDLKEELIFYKHLLTSTISSKSSTQVEVTHFTLNYDNENQFYPYKLVLTQWTKEAQLAEGLVQIRLLGKENGKTKLLNMESITDNHIEALEYQLTYFQRISDYLQLPKGFIPESLIIRILPKDQKNMNEIHFRWEELQPKEQS